MCKKFEAGRFFNMDLSEALYFTTGSDCYKCAEEDKRQELSLTGYYETDECGGVYPEIYCHRCKELRLSGDGDFHHYYTIHEEDGFYWIEDKDDFEILMG